MIIPNITPLPPSPQRTDPSTFAARADASLTAQETVFTPELNAFASAVNVTQGEMTVLSATATEQAQIATTQATAAASSALSAGATVWVSGTTYTAGVSKYSPLDGQVYRRMIIGAGTTDPSLDAVNWRVVNGLTSELIVLPFNNLPQIRPSLSLDFANNQSVDPRITFTRASTATYTNPLGRIDTAASGSPRLDWDPVTLACRGFLIEEQRTNLFQYSEQADNAYWSKNGVITPDALMAPDGTLTADKLAETSATQSTTVVKAITGTTNTNSYTFSRYLKAGEKTTAVLLIQEVPTYARYSWCVFDLSAGTMGAVTNAGGSSGGVATMQAVGNGWYRCSITATLGGTDTSITCPTYPGSLISMYPGTAGAGIFIWGAQLEAGAFPTSYIPTVASQVTRAADVASMTGANFSSWYRQDEGSLLANFSTPLDYTAGFYSVFSISDGTANNRISAECNASGNVINIETFSSGTASTGFFPVYSVGSSSVAIATKSNDANYAKDGIAGTTDTSVVVPAVSQLNIGSGSTSGTQLNGHLRAISFYPKRLTNAELQALSTQ